MVFDATGRRTDKMQFPWNLCLAAWMIEGREVVIQDDGRDLLIGWTAKGTSWHECKADDVALIAGPPFLQDYGYVSIEWRDIHTHPVWGSLWCEIRHCTVACIQAACAVIELLEKLRKLERRGFSLGWLPGLGPEAVIGGGWVEGWDQKKN